MFTAVYDEKGTEGRFAGARARTPRSCSACGRPRAPSARCCRCIPHAVESLDLRGYDTVISSSSAWAHGVLVDPGRGARLLLPQPVPLRLERARGDAARPRPAAAPAAAAAAQPLAPVGLDRRPAGRRLRRQLARSRPRGCAATSGRDATVLHPPVELERFAPGPRRRALPRAGGADGAQAHRRRRARVQPARGGRSSSSATARSCGGCGASPARPSASPAACRTRAWPSCCRSARALVVTAAEEFGIAAVEALASGRPGDRARRGRRARERARGGDRRLLRAATTPRRWPTRSRRSIRSRSTRPAASPPPSASAPPASRPRCGAIVAQAVEAERPPRPGRPAGGRHRPAAAPGHPARRLRLSAAHGPLSSTLSCG